MKRTLPVLLIFFVSLFYSCDNTKKPTREYDNISSTADDSAIEYDKTDNYVIGYDGFMGLKLGDPINADSRYLKKEVKTEGDKTYSGYAIFDDSGNRIGFVYPRINDDKLVNRIEINSPEYRTTKGINVGSSFQELQNAYPNIKTNGSEADGTTTATSGNYRFILDATFDYYEVDLDDISPDTKIKKIYISENNK